MQIKTVDQPELKLYGAFLQREMGSCASALRLSEKEKKLVDYQKLHLAWLDRRARLARLSFRALV